MVCQDLYRPLQPCNSNIFTVLAELRKCGLTDSETCLKSVTLSLGGGQTVSIMGELRGAPAEAGPEAGWEGHVHTGHRLDTHSYQRVHPLFVDLSGDHPQVEHCNCLALVLL